MRNFVFTFIAISLFIAACQTGGDQTMHTPNGFEITFERGPSDTLVSPGDIAKIYFQVSNKDSMVTPTPQIQDVKIPSGDATADIVGGIAMMGVGDSAIIHVPFDSLPPQTKQNPAASEGLNYHIGMISVMDSAAFMQQRMMEQQAAMQKVADVDSMVQDYLKQYKAGTLEGVMESNSGLEYYIIEEGAGEPIEQGEQITVDYYGLTMEDGQMFDNSFKRGQGLTLNVGQGQVIPGWDEGLQYFNFGGEGLLFIPSDLAYGEQGQGPIKPNSDLLFYVDIAEK
jgi:FKBP-type peptidyl-prolyl cis-trans isomerase